MLKRKMQEEIIAFPGFGSLRSCLTDPVCNSFHIENSKSLWKRFQTYGQQAGRVAIFRHNLEVLKLCSSSLHTSLGQPVKCRLLGPVTLLVKQSLREGDGIERPGIPFFAS